MSKATEKDTAEVEDEQGKPVELEQSPPLGAFEAIHEVHEAYDADVYVYSAGVDYLHYGRIVQAFRRDRSNALLILTTNGGLANAAYKIARFFHHQYDELLVVIPSVCKSAGTLLAIGAHRLIMGPFSELGPLDVQLYEKDEISARKSGLLTHSAFEALQRETFSVYEHVLLNIKQRSIDNISFSVASNVAANIASSVMAPVYGQISPTVLGSDFRDLQVASAYGHRLCLISENISPLGVQILTESYPSHDFIIDTDEANGLFENVEPPTDALWKLIGALGDFVLSEHDPGFVVRLSDMVPTEGDDDDEEGEVSDTGAAGVDGGSGEDRQGADRARGKRKPLQTEGGEPPAAKGAA